MRNDTKAAAAGHDYYNIIPDDGDDLIISVDEEERYIDAVLTMLIGIEMFIR